jgi:cellulose synthase (UDP-forming)
LKERGSRTVYLNERLTLGLAPEGLKEYITQRSRWCLGFMQIMRGRSGPFSMRSRLTLIDRLSLIDAFMSWAAVYGIKVFGLVVPWLFLLFGIKAVHADLFELLKYFLPFYVWHAFTMAWISRGRSMAIMTDVSQYIAAPAVLKAVVTGLVKPQGHKFEVTAKGGDRNRRFIEWPLLRLYGSALLITLLAIAYAFILNPQAETVAFGGLALAWSLYNSVVLAIVCLVCPSASSATNPSWSMRATDRGWFGWRISRSAARGSLTLHLHWSEPLSNASSTARTYPQRSHVGPTTALAFDSRKP